MNCSSDLKNIANSRPSVSNFKRFSRSQEHFFLTVGQNNFGEKIPFLLLVIEHWCFKFMSDKIPFENPIFALNFEFQTRNL